MEEDPDQQQEVVFGMDQDMAQDDQESATVDGPSTECAGGTAAVADSVVDKITIKQELNDNVEVEQETQVLIEGQEGIHISLDEFVNFHNDQMKTLKDELVYTTRGFDILYKFKTVMDLIVDEYFKDDKNFRYKSIVDSLETDLMTFIAEDEEKYQNLVSDVNVDVVLNEHNQLEFVEMDNPNEDDEEVMNGTDLVGGVPTIRRLPGQKPAPMPECPACGEKTRCRLKLEAHILEHKDNPVVVCNHDNCEMTFDLHSLAYHEKNYHPEICLICEMCNEGFDNKTTLIQHYKLHITKKERLKCNFPGCDYTDIYPGRLDRHKKTEHNIEVTKQFKCDFEGCGRIFKDRPSYYTHSLIHKDRSLVYKHKCSYEQCGAVFKRRRNLALHMLKHGYVKRKYTCMFGECRRTYTREKELMRHIELVHKSHLAKQAETAQNEEPNEGANKPIKEDIDETEEVTPVAETSNAATAGAGGMVTRRSLRLKASNPSETTVDQPTTAETTVSVEEETPATETATSAKQKLLMLMNKANKSPSNNQDAEELGEIGDIYQEDELIGTECELCSITFDTQEDLLNHLKDRHHQYTVRAYRCDHDDCTFSTHFRSVLGKHKNDVHGGKYKCEVCGKLSKDSGNHNRHRNIHKNILYRCRVPNCEAVYKSPKAYYVHVLTHSNEQPVFRCDHPGCKYITYYMNTLNVHKLTHSDVRNFFCPYDNCGKGFKRNGDLNKHIIHSHKGVKRPQKKRRNETAQQYQCTIGGCPFTTSDSNILAKHEEEHIAAENVEKFE